MNRKDYILHDKLIITEEINNPDSFHKIFNISFNYSCCQYIQFLIHEHYPSPANVKQKVSIQSMNFNGIVIPNDKIFPYEIDTYNRGNNKKTIV